MKKINAGWIVLIVFCSLIIITGLVYLFYRLYINHIYKRKQFWNEITSPLKKRSEEIIDQNLTFLMPRQSLIPLIQEFLPHELKKQAEQRKMIFQSQFDEPPLLLNNLKAEWDEMDTKSLFSLQLMSTQTSYDTIRGQISSEESTLDEKSLVKHFSVISSDEFITPLSSIEQLSSNSNSQKRSPLHFSYTPFANSSRSSLDNEKTVSDKNQKINISNNVSKV